MVFTNLSLVFHQFRSLWEGNVSVGSELSYISSDSVGADATRDGGSGTIIGLTQLTRA